MGHWARTQKAVRDIWCDFSQPTQRHAFCLNESSKHCVNLAGHINNWFDLGTSENEAIEIEHTFKAAHIQVTQITTNGGFCHTTYTWVVREIEICLELFWGISPSLKHYPRFRSWVMLLQIFPKNRLPKTCRRVTGACKGVKEERARSGRESV